MNGEVTVKLPHHPPQAICGVSTLYRMLPIYTVNGENDIKSKKEIPQKENIIIEKKSDTGSCLSEIVMKIDSFPPSLLFANTVPIVPWYDRTGQ